MQVYSQYRKWYYYSVYPGRYGPCSQHHQHRRRTPLRTRLESEDSRGNAEQSHKRRRDNARGSIAAIIRIIVLTALAVAITRVTVTRVITIAGTITRVVIRARVVTVGRVIVRVVGAGATLALTGSADVGVVVCITELDVEAWREGSKPTVLEDTLRDTVPVGDRVALTAAALVTVAHTVVEGVEVAFIRARDLFEPY